MPHITTDIVNAAIAGEGNTVKNVVHSVLLDKQRDHLDVKRTEIARSWLNDETDEGVDVEDGGQDGA